MWGGTNHNPRGGAEGPVQDQTLAGHGQRDEVPPSSRARTVIAFEGLLPLKRGLSQAEALQRPEGRASVAATSLDHHIAVFAQDDVVAAVIVEHGGGAQLGGRAACLGHRVWLHQVHLARERHE